MDRRRIPALLFGVAFGFGLLLLRFSDPFFVRTIRELSFDQMQILRPRPFSELPVRIVDIDEASLRALGQWPWPRTLLAEMTERLSSLGASAIAFDALFMESDRLSRS